MSVTQVMEQYQSILEEEVQDIAYETGAVKRRGKLDAKTFIQLTILVVYLLTVGSTIKETPPSRKGGLFRWRRSR